jgi:hypothetical protein
VPIRWVLIRDPAETFATQALLCTDLMVAPAQMIAWFVRRWQMEVMFAETRRPLGDETQRQWSEQAIRPTTPVLLELFALVTLLADRHLRDDTGVPSQATWYRKVALTVADAMAAVRRAILVHEAFRLSDCGAAMVNLPHAPFARLTEALCSIT